MLQVLCLCLHPETNKVSSAQANNLSTAFYAIYMFICSNGVAVAAKKTNKWNWGPSPFTCLSW